MAETSRAAFVTGAGRNIGRAVALALARQGCDVVVNGRADRAACEEVAGEIEALGRRAIVAIGDIGRSDEIAAMADAALSAFGSVQIVVNNAAIRPQTALVETTDADWHRVLDTDLNSAFYTARAFAPGMIEAGWGRIVSMTGMNAIHGYAGRAAVSAAKHGLWGLTKALAKELGPQGVTVNAISPGPIDTEHADASMTAHIKMQKDRIPVGRLGTPEDIAALTAFLCSDAGGFVNGQMIASNGGAQT